MIGPRHLAAAIVVATLAALAPPSEAAPPRSAQRFADAVERAKSAIRAKRPEVKAAVAAVEYERCRKAFDADNMPPDDEEERMFALQVSAQHWATLGPILPALQTMVADLDAIPTRDPALKSGRSAWREFVSVGGRYPRIDRPCHRLEEWAASGFRAELRPPIDPEAWRRAENALSDEWPRKLGRAELRLRALGVTKEDARRFAGDELFSDLDDLIEVFEGSPE